MVLTLKIISQDMKADSQNAVFQFRRTCNTTIRHNQKPVLFCTEKIHFGSNQGMMCNM